MRRPTQIDLGFLMAERIVAVGLLTQRDLDVLGVGFSRAFPVDQTPCFSELLRAIDDPDRELWSDRDRATRVGRTDG